MTPEERIAQLEQELAELKDHQAAPSLYSKVITRCNEYAACMEAPIKLPILQSGRNACRQLANEAFRRKRHPKGRRKSIIQCIKTEEEAEELFDLFQGFLLVWLDYMKS